MNYQTFSNLKFKLTLNNSFHSIYIYLRATSGEKIPFAFVGITCLDLVFTKASNNHFYSKRRYKMVALRQVDIPLYRAIGRQRVWRFGTLAQVIGRSPTPILCKYVVPATKRVVMEFLEMAVPEVAAVDSGRNFFSTAAKCVGRQTLRNHLESDSRIRTASRVILPKSAKGTSRPWRDIFTKISLESCRGYFGTNVSWQSLEILAGKDQLLTMSCRSTNRKFILLPHSMKIA